MKFKKKLNVEGNINKGNVEGKTDTIPLIHYKRLNIFFFKCAVFLSRFDLDLKHTF